MERENYWIKSVEDRRMWDKLEEAEKTSFLYCLGQALELESKDQGEASIRLYERALEMCPIPSLISHYKSITENDDSNNNSNIADDTADYDNDDDDEEENDWIISKGSSKRTIIEPKASDSPSLQQQKKKKRSLRQSTKDSVSVYALEAKNGVEERLAAALMTTSSPISLSRTTASPSAKQHRTKKSMDKLWDVLSDIPDTEEEKAQLALLRQQQRMQEDEEDNNLFSFDFKPIFLNEPGNNNSDSENNRNSSNYSENNRNNNNDSENDSNDNNDDTVADNANDNNDNVTNDDKNVANDDKNITTDIPEKSEIEDDENIDEDLEALQASLLYVCNDLESSDQSSAKHSDTIVLESDDEVECIEIDSSSASPLDDNQLNNDDAVASFASPNVGFSMTMDDPNVLVEKETEDNCTETDVKETIDDSEETNDDFKETKDDFQETIDDSEETKVECKDDFEEVTDDLVEAQDDMVQDDIVQDDIVQDEIVEDDFEEEARAAIGFNASKSGELTELEALELELEQLEKEGDFESISTSSSSLSDKIVESFIDNSSAADDVFEDCNSKIVEDVEMNDTEDEDSDVKIPSHDEEKLDLDGIDNDRIFSDSLLDDEEMDAHAKDEKEVDEIVQDTALPDAIIEGTNVSDRNVVPDDIVTIPDEIVADKGILYIPVDETDVPNEIVAVPDEDKIAVVDNIAPVIELEKEDLIEAKEEDFSDIEMQDVDKMDDLNLSDRLFKFQYRKTYHGCVIMNGYEGDNMSELCKFLRESLIIGTIRNVLVVATSSEELVKWECLLCNSSSSSSNSNNTIQIRLFDDGKSQKIVQEIQVAGGVCLTTQEMLQTRLIKLINCNFLPFQWDYVVFTDRLDHAASLESSLANRQSPIWIAAKSIKAERRVVLLHETGFTSTSSNIKAYPLASLWALFDLACDSQLLGSFTVFQFNYIDPIRLVRLHRCLSIDTATKGL